jgi:hypothetical protein
LNGDALVSVPSELRAVFRRNQILLHGLLMRVSATAVKDLSVHELHRGALPRMLSVPHNWNGQFRTAIRNARILGMDQAHVIFRWKDRCAYAWRTERLPG